MIDPRRDPTVADPLRPPDLLEAPPDRTAGRIALVVIVGILFAILMVDRASASRSPVESRQHGAGASVLDPRRAIETPPAPTLRPPVIVDPLLDASAPARPIVDQPAGDRVVVGPTPAAPRAPTGAGVTGPASWYDWHLGEAAAGPALRVGAWRGRVVSVCCTPAGKPIVVRLTDFCGCPGGRVIDLDDASFAALAPLSAGLVRVTVSW